MRTTYAGEERDEDGEEEELGAGPEWAERDGVREGKGEHDTEHADGDAGHDRTGEQVAVERIGDRIRPVLEGATERQVEHRGVAEAVEEEVMIGVTRNTTGRA